MMEAPKAYKSTNYVNANQTPDERKRKYWLARSFGFSSYMAQRLRDFPLDLLEKTLALALFADSITPEAVNQRLSVVKQTGYAPWVKGRPRMSKEGLESDLDIV